MKKRKKNQERGITLITLVITIIVLLIIAAIALALLKGDSGVITKAQESKVETVKSEEKEKLKLLVNGTMDGNYNGKINRDKLRENIVKELGDEVEFTENEDEFFVTFVESGRTYIIMADGEILEEEEDIPILILKPQSINIKLGETATIRAVTNLPSAITWESSNSNIVEIPEESTGNTILNIKAKEVEGSCTITAKVQKTGESGNVMTKTATCTINVSSGKIEPTGIGLSLSGSRVIDLNSSNKTRQLTATITPAGANEKTNITWSSSNPEVASVSGSGRTAVITGKTAGTAIITAITGNGISKTCEIVCEKKITSIAVEPTSANMTVGETKQIQTTIEPSDVTENLTWTSSNGSVASVTQTGLVTATGAGTATITVKSSTADVKASCTITVVLENGVFVSLNGSTLGFYNNSTEAKANADSDSHYYGDIINEEFHREGTPWYGDRTTITQANIANTIYPKNTKYWFYDLEVLTGISNMTNLKTVNVTDMKGMFRNCLAVKDLEFSGFDTSNVTDMSYMFYSCETITSLDLSKFNTKNVTSMTNMFNNCNDLISIDISNFDTSKVTEMNGMFCACDSLTSLDVSKFNTSNVTNMDSMFYGCSSLTEIDVSNFDTSKVTDMNSMFCYCTILANLDVSGFDTSDVTDMKFMFYGCDSLTSLNLSSFDTRNVTDMSYMFYSCKAITSLNLSNFDTNKVTDMNSMFCYCTVLTNLDVSGFDTSNVTVMQKMFYSCEAITSLNLSNFDTRNVTDINSMFYHCDSLTSLNLSNFNTSNVTDMQKMFYSCANLRSIDVSNFNTSKVTNMEYMFYKCALITNLDVSEFDTTEVTNMKSMFSRCTSLSNLDVSNFNTSKVTNMNDMFKYCYELTSIDVSNFDTSKVTDIGSMFNGCKKLTTITGIESWNTSSVTNKEGMFTDCPAPKPTWF